MGWGARSALMATGAGSMEFITAVGAGGEQGRVRWWGRWCGRWGVRWWGRWCGRRGVRWWRRWGFQRHLAAHCGCFRMAFGSGFQVTRLLERPGQTGPVSCVVRFLLNQRFPHQDRIAMLQTQGKSKGSLADGFASMSPNASAAISGPAGSVGGRPAT